MLKILFPNVMKGEATVVWKLKTISTPLFVKLVKEYVLPEKLTTGIKKSSPRIAETLLLKFETSMVEVDVKFLT